LLDTLSELEVESNLFYDSAIKKLWLIIGNIIKNPDEEKYKQIKLTNQVFNLNIGRFSNGMKLMKQLGFVPVIIPGDKWKGTNDEKILKYPHMELS